MSNFLKAGTDLVSFYRPTVIISTSRIFRCAVIRSYAEFRLRPYLQSSDLEPIIFCQVPIYQSPVL